VISEAVSDIMHSLNLKTPSYGGVFYFGFCSSTTNKFTTVRLFAEHYNQRHSRENGSPEIGHADTSCLPAPACLRTRGTVFLLSAIGLANSPVRRWRIPGFPRRGGGMTQMGNHQIKINY